MQEVMHVCGAEISRSAGCTDALLCDDLFWVVLACRGVGAEEIKAGSASQSRWASDIFIFCSSGLCSSWCGKVPGNSFSMPLSLVSTSSASSASSASAVSTCIMESERRGGGLENGAARQFNLASSLSSSLFPSSAGLRICTSGSCHRGSRLAQVCFALPLEGNPHNNGSLVIYAFCHKDIRLVTLLCFLNLHFLSWLYSSEPIEQ